MNLWNLEWHSDIDTLAVLNKQEPVQVYSQRTLDLFLAKKEIPSRNPVYPERIGIKEFHLDGSKVVYVQHDIGILRTAVFRLDLGRI